MVNVTITVSEEEVKRRLGILANKSGQVIARAANRSINTGKKAIKQETAQIYNVRQRDVEEIVKIRKATQANPTAKLTFKDRHKNLYSFGKESTVKPRYPVRSSNSYDPDPGYVTATVKKTRTNVPLSGRPKPFVQISPQNGYILLFQRKSNDARAPLRGVAAPALPQIVKNEKVMARFSRDAGSMFVKRLDHEITRVLKEGK